MKTILTIGYTKFLLPDSANINAVLSVLNKARLVEEELIDGEYVIVPSAKEHHRNPVAIELVDDAKVLSSRPKRKSLPEIASPDAHNTF